MTPELIDSPVDLDNCRSLLADRDRQIATLEGDVVGLRQRLNDALEACGTPPFTFDKPSQTPIDQEQVLGRGIRPVEIPTPKESNGVTAPKSGVTRKVWDAADQITEDNKKEGKPPASKFQVVAFCILKGIKETTAQAAYSSWCKFHSINAKDTSKPYVAKEKKEKAEVVVVEATGAALAEFAALAPNKDDGLSIAAAFSFMLPPPLPVFLPPPPLPLQ